MALRGAEKEPFGVERFYSSGVESTCLAYSPVPGSVRESRPPTVLDFGEQTGLGSAGLN